MERKKFLLLMSMLISSLSFAGNEVGNGGLGFFCSKTDQYVLLDFFEYELLHPEKKIIASSGSFEKILGERLSLLEKLDKKNSQLYSKKTAEIVKKINYLNDITLSKTDDSFEIASPLGCELRQFAIQKKNSSDNSVDFYFDKKIWEKLDAKTRAGLVLHEVIYEHFLSLGEKNSINARKMNSFIFSKNFEEVTLQQYNKFVASLKVPLY